MKKLIIILAVLFAWSISAQAQSGDVVQGESKDKMEHHNMMAGEGRETHMCMPMMRQMTGHGMMMRDMMQMMKDMMRMQKNMMKELKPAERKEMMMEINRMMDHMDRMMSDIRGTMMKGMMMHCPMEQTEEAPSKEETPKAEPHKH